MINPRFMQTNPKEAPEITFGWHVDSVFNRVVSTSSPLRSLADLDGLVDEPILIGARSLGLSCLVLRRRNFQIFYLFLKSWSTRVHLASSLFGANTHPCQWWPGCGDQKAVSSLRYTRQFDMDSKTSRITYVMSVRSNDGVWTAEITDLTLDHGSAYSKSWNEVTARIGC